MLGPFRVGDNARIAAGAVVLKEVPEDATAVGVPARVVSIAGERSCYADAVDQISVTDPVAIELTAIYAQLQVLEQELTRQKLEP